MTSLPSSLTEAAGCLYRTHNNLMNTNQKPILRSTSHRKGHSTVSKALSISKEATTLEPILRCETWLLVYNLCKLTSVALPAINPVWSESISVGNMGCNRWAMSFVKILKSTFRRAMVLYYSVRGTGGWILWWFIDQGYMNMTH